MIARLAILITCLAHVISLRAEQLPTRVYTVADGLPGNGVNAIHQDTRGFIWFGTTEGITRFDGYQFRNFGNAEGLPVGANDLLETPAGEFWVATRSGLYHFNPSALGKSSPFVHYGPVFRASVLAADGKGGLWCGARQGLYHVVRSSNNTDPWVIRLEDIGMPTQLHGSVVDGLFYGHGGVLWIAARSGLYRRFPDGRSERYTVTDGLSDDHAMSILEDHLGTVWVGTWNGLCRVSRRRDRLGKSVERMVIEKFALPDRHILSLLESSDGRFWIGTDIGVSELLNREGHPRVLDRTPASYPNQSYAQSLMEDRAGNLWAASDGAWRFTREGFLTYTKADGLASGNIRSIFEDQEGALCVVSGPGSDDDRVAVNWFDGEHFHPVRPNIPSNKMGGWGWNQVTFQDHLGEWWVPTGNGLFRFPAVSAIDKLAKPHPTAFFYRPDGKNPVEAFRVFEDSRGDIWVGTQGVKGEGLLRWERATGILHQVGVWEGEHLPSAFAEDRAGNIWIGSTASGLARYRGGHLQFFHVDKHVPDSWVETIYGDSQGRLWVALADQGILRIDKPEADLPSFLHLTTADGPSSNRTRCIIEDRWGRIYVGGNHGVDRFYPRAPLRVRQYTNNGLLIQGTTVLSAITEAYCGLEPPPAFFVWIPSPIGPKPLRSC